MQSNGGVWGKEGGMCVCVRERGNERERETYILHIHTHTHTEMVSRPLTASHFIFQMPHSHF